MLIAAAMLVTLSATDIWVEHSMRDVLPDTTPDTASSRDARLYAARGEFESFQICLRASKRQHEIQFELTPLDDEIPAPAVYLKDPGHADALRPTVAFTLPPDVTHVLWVTYRVPRGAPSGLHAGQFRLLLDGSRKLNVPVNIQVFDFDLPDTPRLRALFTLDWPAMGLDPADPDVWRHAYDMLATHRVSVAPTLSHTFVGQSPDRTVDAALMQTHLRYATSAAYMNTISLGGAELLRMLPEPPVATLQDPLQLYLQDMGNWLQRLGWIDRAVCLGAAVPERDQWQAVRRSYFRTQRADKRIARILVGGMYPFFERYTDIFAVPPDLYNPYAHDALKRGNSLIEYAPVVPSRIQTSGNGTVSNLAPVGTLPEDACDGSVFSWWRSGRAPSEDKPVWIVFQFSQSLRTKEFFTAWAAFQEPSVCRVATSMDGHYYIDAKTSWDATPAINRHDVSWTHATFDIERVFQFLRLEIPSSHSGSPVALAEFLFSDERSLSNEPVRPKELWIDITDDALPSLRNNRHPLESRIAPWLCQSYGMNGIWGGPLWSRESNLVYLDDGALTPSIRLERFRDGIEDFEYHQEIQSHVPEFQVRLNQGFAAATSSGTRELAVLISPYLYDPAPGKAVLDAALGQLVKSRIAMGLAIGDANRSRMREPDRGTLP